MIQAEKSMSIKMKSENDFNKKTTTISWDFWSKVNHHVIFFRMREFHPKQSSPPEIVACPLLEMTTVYVGKKKIDLPSGKLT